MAIELLKAKGDNKELGIHWTDAFLQRYPILKSKFISGLDKEPALAQDPSIVKAWFQLFEHTVSKYNIHLNDIYNMDEKGIIMGDIGKVKVIVSRHERQQYMT